MKRGWGPGHPAPPYIEKRGGGKIRGKIRKKTMLISKVPRACWKRMTRGFTQKKISGF